MDQPPQDPTQPTPPAPGQPTAPAGWAQPAPPAGGPAWGQPAPGQAAPPAPGPSWGQPAAPPPAPAPAGWAQPAPTGSQWVQPAAVKGRVTTLARIAGIIVALIGALWAFIGAITVLGGALFKGFLDNLNTGTNAGDVFGGAIAVVGVIILVVALFELIAGLAAAFGKDWGRIVSIVYSFLFGVPLLLITFSAATAARNEGVSTTDAFGAIIFLVAHVVAYIFAAIVLMARWRGRATA